MTIKKAMQCAKTAIDKKAENLKLLDLSKISGFTDYFLICSAISDRQVKAICNAIEMTMNQQNHDPISIEGYNDGRWIVMDYADIVIHVFMDSVREYYHLETLWGDAKRVPIPQEFYTTMTSRFN